MKKSCALLGLFFAVVAVRAQQLKMGVNWPAVQSTTVELKKPLRLDSSLQDKRFFVMEKIAPVTPLQIDFPGLYAQYDWRNRFYLRTEFRISSTKFRIGPTAIPDNPDTLFIDGTWTVNRPMFTAECGYLFGHKKTWNPFMAAGVSFSVFKFHQDRISSYGYDDYDASNYYNHFANDPWFVSLQFRAGFERRAFTFSTSIKTSFTSSDSRQSTAKIGCWSLLEIGWHFYRSGFMAKRQYEEVTGINSINQTLRVDLKKSGACTGLRVPLYAFAMDQPYLDAWENEGSNYVVSINGAPEQRLSGEIFGNNIRGLNDKKTWYLRSEYGANVMTFLYKHILRKTASTFGMPDTEDKNDLVINSEDVKHFYINLFYTLKTGYRIKTGKKSFVFGDMGVRYQLSLKRYKNETDVPYIKKSLLWLNPEIGFQSGHKGVQLGVLSTIGKPDAFMIYKNITAFYIGIYHEIYSK